MNFTEILKAQNLTDEQIVKISAEMKSNKIYLASEENLDVRYNKLKLESEQANQELAKSQALITELQNGNRVMRNFKPKLKVMKMKSQVLKRQTKHKEWNLHLIEFYLKLMSKMWTMLSTKSKKKVLN